jgi:hypothetical protein
MKAIVSAILVLASSGYAIAGALLLSSVNPSAWKDAPTFGFIAFTLLILGFCLLIFNRDKPTS